MSQAIDGIWVVGTTLLKLKFAHAIIKHEEM